MSSKKTSLLNLETYDPICLLNQLRHDFKIKRDVELAVLLKISPPLLSKIRNSAIPIGTSLLVRIHELTGLPINTIRYKMGDMRDSFFD